MGATSASVVTLDLISVREEIGQLAKLGAALDRDVQILEATDSLLPAGP